MGRSGTRYQGSAQTRGREEATKSFSWGEVVIFTIVLDQLLYTLEDFPDCDSQSHCL